MVACRRQADVWQRVVLYTQGWGRMDTLGTLTNTQTTSYQPIACRRVKGWYKMVCSNGYIYLSNTGEIWRGIGATNRAINVADIGEDGNVYANEYNNIVYRRHVKTADYVNWAELGSVTLTQTYDRRYHVFGSVCKVQPNGYVYMTGDYCVSELSPGWLDNARRLSANSSVWRVKEGEYSKAIEDTFGAGETFITLWVGAQVEILCANIVNSKIVLSRRMYDRGGSGFGETFSMLYFDGASVNPPANEIVTDCVYVGSKYILSAGSNIYVTSGFSSYTLKISTNAKRMREYGGIAYICATGGLYTTTDGDTFTNRDSTREYYDVAVIQ